MRMDLKPGQKIKKGDIIAETTQDQTIVKVVVLNVREVERNAHTTTVTCMVREIERGESI